MFFLWSSLVHLIKLTLSAFKKGCRILFQVDSIADGKGPFSPLCLVFEEDLNVVVDAMTHLVELAELGMDACVDAAQA